MTSTLEQEIGELLLKKGSHLVVAESCTGGFLASRITNVPGASRYFECGVITYSDRAKQDWLGVSSKTLKEFGAVSSEVAIEMAQGILERSGADYALSVTGIAGPGGGSLAKPVGTVFIACVGPKEVKVEHHLFSEGRLIFKEKVAEAALKLLKYVLQS